MDYSTTLHTTAVNTIGAVEKVGPTLVEPGVKYFLSESLHNCKEVKLQLYNNIFNISLFLFLTFGIGTFLYVKYKNKLSPQEKQKKNKEVSNYINNKIKSLEKEQQHKRNEMITNIPEFESEHHIRNKFFL